KELNSTQICHFNNKETMNYALARASCFIEGSFCGKPKGTVIGFMGQEFPSAVLQVNGYNLRGSDLEGFHRSIKEKCSSDHSLCLNSYEENIFEKLILPSVKEDPNYVLITFARFGSGRWYDTLFHEI